MNLQKLMKQAKEAQKKLAEFDEEEFEFDYKKVIQIRIKGSLEILSINVDKELVDPDDKTMLEEMIAEAINEAIASVNEERNKATPFGMNMPF